MGSMMKVFNVDNFLKLGGFQQLKLLISSDCWSFSRQQPLETDSFDFVKSSDKAILIEVIHAGFYSS